MIDWLVGGKELVNFVLVAQELEVKLHFFLFPMLGKLWV